MSIPKLSIIAAIATNNIIGNNNSLPWDIPEDRQYFRNLTLNNIIIMGRKTYESLPKILDNRINIVVIKNNNYPLNDQIIRAYNYDEALQIANDYAKIEHKDIFVIGGESCYRYFLPITTYLYITKLYYEAIGDTYFPNYDKDQFTEIYKIYPETNYNSYEIEFCKYIRK